MTIKTNHVLASKTAIFMLIACAAACDSSSTAGKGDAAMDANSGAVTSDGPSRPGTGGSVSSGAGGSVSPGAGGSVPTGVGGSVPTGAGGARDAAVSGDTAGMGDAKVAATDAAPNNSIPGVPVNLGTAGTYVILAKSAISTVPPAAITGNLGISPAAATFITGFSLVADATSVFSTSSQVTGKVYAATYTPPTPALLTTAVGDMELAFTSAAGRPAGVTELGAGNIGGMTLAPGVYKWGSGLLIPTDVTLNGSATSVWIFQIAQDLTMSSAKKIHLTGGALAKNVFWQVSGRVELGTTAHFEGVILCKTSITLRTGASINGRLLAQTAVVIDTSKVVEPAR